LAFVRALQLKVFILNIIVYIAINDMLKVGLNDPFSLAFNCFLIIKNKLVKTK